MENNLGLTTSFVISSNDLIEAKYDYSLWEKRVFLYMISTLKRNDTGFKPVRIYIRDLMRFFGTQSNNDYSVIRAIPETISQKPFYVPYTTPEGFKRWNIVSVLSIGSQPEVGDRSEGNAYIELKFNSDLIPYLLELKEKFTKYDIRNITGLKSVYSIRLYEYMKENEFRKGSFEIKIEALKDMFFMSAKDNDGKELYPLYADFKKRVLLKAQEDLLQHCDIRFSFWEKKQGKKVTSVVFEVESNQKIKHNEAQTSEINENETEKDTKKQRQDLFKELFSQAQVLDIGESALKHVIENYSASAVRQGFEYTMLEYGKGKVKENVEGYFITAVKNGYTSSTFEKVQKQKQRSMERKQREAEYKTLAMQLAHLRDEYDLRRNAIIREITTENEDITLHAIDALQADLQNYFRLKNLDPADLDIEDYRQDPILRVYVIEKIQAQNPMAFEPLAALKEDIERVGEELEKLK
jgi:plasmid replication initiation protein